MYYFFHGKKMTNRYKSIIFKAWKSIKMKETNRPPLLEALCLLSFAGSGAGFFLYLSAALFFETAEKIIDHWSSLTDTSLLTPGYFGLFSLLFLISLTGVYLMWKMFRLGFVLYATAQLAIFCWPLVWLGTEAFSSVTLVFTVLFTGLYATQVKKMKGYSLENSRTLSR